MIVSAFDVLDAPNRTALMWKIVQAFASNDSAFPITIRERLDELTAMRRKARTLDVRFRPSNIDLNEDDPVLLGAVIIEKHARFARIMFEDEILVLTLSEPMALPTP